MAVSAETLRQGWNIGARAFAREFALGSLGVLALAVSAKARVVLPVSPVPITAQTLAVLLLAGLLGQRRALASVIAYLAVGIAGAPVFALGGGSAYLLGPTGGYLLGLIPAAWLAGGLVDRGWERNVFSLAAALLLADAALFALGMAWLALYVPLAALPVAGLLFFAPGEAVKIALAAMVIRRLRN